MTYRDIFLQADPCAVNDAIGAQGVEVKGLKVLFNTHQTFDICKGLKFFAQGEIRDESAEEALEKTLKANPRLTIKQAKVLIAGLKGYLSAACEVLGFNQASNPDEFINEWLDQTMTDCSGDANKLAANIISKLIKDNIKRYERLKS